MAVATKSQKTARFALSCPFCGSGEDNTLNLDLLDLDRICCGSCNEEYSPAKALAKATKTMEAWAQVVRWIELAHEAIGD